MSKTKKVLVLNGPNLNLLGTREPEIYGSETLDQIKDYLASRLGEQTPDWEWFQSNEEGKLVDRIHKALDEKWNAIVFNPGAYSHTSIALLDALKAFNGLKFEVHMSNTNAREEFRKTKITACGANGVVEGFGKNSYLYALMEIVNS